METTTENNRVKEFYLKSEAQKRAGADPIPGAAGDAFSLHGDIKIGSSGITVRRVVASDWQIFKAIDSPILKVLLELRQNPNSEVEVEVTTDEEWEMAYQFTRPVSECRKALVNGKDAFTQAAREHIGDLIDVSVVSLIRLAVMEQVRRSFQSAITYKQEMEKEGEVTFFPDAEANPKMASAGGSTTLGGS